MAMPNIRLRPGWQWLIFTLYLAATVYLFYLFACLPANEPGYGSFFRSGHRSRAGKHSPRDNHPISKLTAHANHQWERYVQQRPSTFREAIRRYHEKQGRSPPPGFAQWARFAAARNIFHLDDFDRINDDLRPLWGVPPAELRALAARMWMVDDAGISVISIRNRRIVGHSKSGWRSKAYASMIESFVQYLPDMDIPINSMDEPRVIAPWSVVQEALTKEERARKQPLKAQNRFTFRRGGLLKPRRSRKPVEGDVAHPEFFSAESVQYMELAKTACPPTSHAVQGLSVEAAESTWKAHGLIANHNLSVDLCTSGPELQNLHGFFTAATSNRPTKRLVPVFSECKTSVNNDILIPPPVYINEQENYRFDNHTDLDWSDKKDIFFWRGAPSSGWQTESNWRHLHRQRLTRMLNASVMDGCQASITSVRRGTARIPLYENQKMFDPTTMLNASADVGFVAHYDCLPDCDFLADDLGIKPLIPMGEHFQYKFLLDVDGRAFSPRWRAFLQSRSLVLKATIFHEWMTSRVFAWKHFVPIDNRFSDIYNIMAYFLGTGTPRSLHRGQAYVPRHDREAQNIALESSNWANTVLRKADMEIYMFRLLLEYGRLIDDDRDRIGYPGDGSELDARYYS